MAGIRYPFSSGTYCLDLLASASGQLSFSMHDQIYLDVYAAPFAAISVQSMVTLLGEENLLLVSFTPAQPIATTHRLVVEIPVISLNGHNLFEEDLGLAISDDAVLKFDIFNSAVSFECRLAHGNREAGIPAKVICASFSATIAAGTAVNFAFRIINPASLPTIGGSIPVWVYSFNPLLGETTNYNVMPNAIHLSTETGPTVPIPSAASQSLPLCGIVTDLTLAVGHTANLVAGDFLVLRFSLTNPINTAYVANGCVNTATATAIGHLAYLKNCQVAICMLFGTLPSAGASLRLLSWANQAYPPVTQERQFYAYESFQHHISFGRMSSKLTYTDMLPSLSVGMYGDGVLSLACVLCHNLRNTADDYTFSFQFSASSTSTLIQYAKRLSINPSGQFTFVGSWCRALPASAIKTSRCWISGGRLWADINPGAWLNNQQFLIRTEGLAVLHSSSLNTFTMEVNLYNWQDASTFLEPPAINAFYFFLIRPTATQFFSHSLVIDDALFTSWTPSPFAYLAAP